MLASMLRFVLLAQWGLAATVFLSLARSGPLIAGLLAALGILGAHAAFLALEFVVLAWAGDPHPAQRPSAGQTLRAWAGEIVAVLKVFCWRQPFLSRQLPDHLGNNAPGRRGVLLIHGFVCNRGLWNDWIRRLASIGTPVIAIDLEPVFGSIDDYRASIDTAVARLTMATGLSPVVVAHSMGGLALRGWWAMPGNETRVHHAVTIGTPHHGTRLARLAVSANTRQMRIGSRWLAALADREPRGGYSRFTCFYGHCDHIVYPAATATLTGADNRHLAAVAHVAMVDRPEPWHELMRQLGAPERCLERG